MRLFPRRNDVYTYHAEQMHKIFDSVVRISAVHYFCHNNLNAGCDVPTEYLQEHDSIVGGLQNTLELCCGARVMPIRNVHTEQGLVNNALGFIHSFVYGDNSHIESINV